MFRKKNIQRTCKSSDHLVQIDKFLKPTAYTESTKTVSAPKQVGVVNGKIRL